MFTRVRGLKWIVCRWRRIKYFVQCELLEGAKWNLAWTWDEDGLKYTQDGKEIRTTPLVYARSSINHLYNFHKCVTSKIEFKHGLNFLNENVNFFKLESRFRNGIIQFWDFTQICSRCGGPSGYPRTNHTLRYKKLKILKIINWNFPYFLQLSQVQITFLILLTQSCSSLYAAARNAMAGGWWLNSSGNTSFRGGVRWSRGGETTKLHLRCLEPSRVAWKPRVRGRRRFTNPRCHESLSTIFVLYYCSVNTWNNSLHFLYHMTRGSCVKKICSGMGWV